MKSELIARIDEDGRLVLPALENERGEDVEVIATIRVKGKDYGYVVFTLDDGRISMHRVTLDVPLDGLALAALSSTDFWDNPIDDEVWNDA